MIPLPKGKISTVNFGQPIIMLVKQILKKFFKSQRVIYQLKQEPMMQSKIILNIQDQHLWFKRPFSYRKNLGKQLSNNFF